MVSLLQVFVVGAHSYIKASGCPRTDRKSFANWLKTPGRNEDIVDSWRQGNMKAIGRSQSNKLIASPVTVNEYVRCLDWGSLNSVGYAPLQCSIFVGSIGSDAAQQKQTRNEN